MRAQAGLGGGINSLESIHGPLKRLKILALPVLTDAGGNLWSSFSKDEILRTVVKSNLFFVPKA